MHPPNFLRRSANLGLSVEYLIHPYDILIHLCLQHSHENDMALFINKREGLLLGFIHIGKSAILQIPAVGIIPILSSRIPGAPMKGLWCSEAVSIYTHVCTHPAVTFGHQSLEYLISGPQPFAVYMLQKSAGRHFCPCECGLAITLLLC